MGFKDLKEGSHFVEKRSNVTIDNKTTFVQDLSFQRTWKDAALEPPKEGGRYWCIIEEQNDLGRSEFQWNCSFNDSTGEWSEDGGKYAKVIYWTEFAPFPSKPTFNR